MPQHTYELGQSLFSSHAIGTPVHVPAASQPSCWPNGESLKQHSSFGSEHDVATLPFFPHATVVVWTGPESTPASFFGPPLLLDEEEEEEDDDELPPLELEDDDLPGFPDDPAGSVGDVSFPNCDWFPGPKRSV